MMNDPDNLNMSAETGVNQSPDSNDAAGNGATIKDRSDESSSDDTVRPEDIAELRAKAEKADENWDKYVRTSADLDNYKKRAARERLDAIKYANEGLLEKLLPIVDNFEAALAAANTAQGTNVDSLRTGINMIYTQLKGFLAEAGVEEIFRRNHALICRKARSFNRCAKVIVFASAWFVHRWSSWLGNHENYGQA
jgi:molecular chaperone GrpE (heat shock protein)